MNMKNVFVMLIILSICMTTISIAGDGYATTLTNETPTPDTTKDQVVNQPTQTPGTPPIPPGTPPIPPGTPLPQVTEKEKKFRQGPTVKIRPLNDVINKSADGLVELYMDNPSLNDVTLTVDARISVPAGIHVYGQGFGEAAAAGTVYGVFEVPPGKARTIYITIKAEKTGDFTAQFSGTYYPGDNKDAYQPISLTHPFKVYESSPNPQSDAPSAPQQGTAKTPGLSAFVSILVICITVLVIKWRQNR